MALFGGSMGIGHVQGGTRPPPEYPEGPFDEVFYSGNLWIFGGAGTRRNFQPQTNWRRILAAASLVLLSCMNPVKPLGWPSAAAALAVVVLAGCARAASQTSTNTSAAAPPPFTNS